MSDTDTDRTTTGFFRRLTEETDGTIWNRFERRYGPILVGTACKLGLNETDARDAAQETLRQFLSYFREGTYDRTSGRLKDCLLGILRHRVIDAIRRKEIRREVALESGSAAPQVQSDEPPEARIEEAWEQSKYENLIKQAFSELLKTTKTTKKNVKIFKMYVIEEDAKKVADYFGISRDVVYQVHKRIFEALVPIRDRMCREYDD